MYTDNYEESVMNDMLSLEIKLLIEKMLEIQKSYHKELNLIINQYNKNGKIFKLLIERIKMLQKKLYLIKKMRDAKNIKSDIYNFIGLYNNNNHHEINSINKNEFFIWNNIIRKQKKIYNELNEKKLKELFKKIIFDKYYKLFDKFNNIENKIIINMMKKYKYNINKNKHEIKTLGSNGNINTNNNNKLIMTASPNQQYKKQNKIGNNKKKHKKTTSCCQVKSTNYNYFKNK